MSGFFGMVRQDGKPVEEQPACRSRQRKKIGPKARKSGVRGFGMRCAVHFAFCESTAKISHPKDLE